MQLTYIYKFITFIKVFASLEASTTGWLEQSMSIQPLWLEAYASAQGVFVKGLSSKILTNSIIVCMILLKDCNGKGQHDNKDIQNRCI